MISAVMLLPAVLAGSRQLSEHAGHDHGDEQGIVLNLLALKTLAAMRIWHPAVSRYSSSKREEGQNGREKAEEKVVTGNGKRESRLKPCAHLKK